MSYLYQAIKQLCIIASFRLAAPYFIPPHARSREILTGSPVSEALTRSLSQPQTPVNVTLKLVSPKRSRCPGEGGAERARPGESQQPRGRTESGPGRWAARAAASTSGTRRAQRTRAGASYFTALL